MRHSFVAALVAASCLFWMTSPASAQVITTVNYATPSGYVNYYYEPSVAVNPYTYNYGYNPYYSYATPYYYTPSYYPAYTYPVYNWNVGLYERPRFFRRWWR